MTPCEDKIDRSFAATPSGVEERFGNCKPVVSLRSTTGYKL